MHRARGVSGASGYQPVETSEYEVLEHEGVDALPDDHPSSTGSWLHPISHVSSDLEDWFSSSRRGSRPSIHDDDFVPTISRADSVTLSQPTPDTHSIHRGTAPNIALLEESAERLSLGSDLGEELKKLQEREKRADSRRSSVRARRQFSTTSHPNSIVNVNSVARLGGFSPEAYVASPSGSFMAPLPAKSAKSQDPTQKIEEQPKPTKATAESRPLDFPPSSERGVLTVRNSTEQDSHQLQSAASSQNLKEPAQDEDANRPNSAASGDTFRRARDAFADFDGVHIHSDTPEIDENQGLLDPEAALIPPDIDETNVTYLPANHEHLIYYPAPVPVMLNLPAKRSKGPSAVELAKRRSEILGSTAQARQSAPEFPGLEESQDVEEQEKLRKRASNVPPQLRASLFFDQPALPQNIEMIDGSAGRTLDSILDASAHAPVTAFTDHPMVGKEGGEIYTTVKDVDVKNSTSAGRATEQKPKTSRQRSGIFAFGRRLRGSTTLDTQQAAATDEEEQMEEKGLENEVEEDDDDDEPIQRPSTLLAELQIRKAQQKRRNRTAADAFPNGMHSTLLQLDTVAQYQKQARKSKQVALAWEDQADVDDDPDDDVPLGLLFPGSAQQQASAGRFPEDKPLGLLAQRSLEENEPLSQRKSRLLGSQVNTNPAVARRATTWAQELQAGVDARGDTDETLGTRKQRMKQQAWAKAEPRPVSGEFASELLSQFGGDKTLGKSQHPSTTPDPEETLGQRKRRLQAEKQARQASSQSAQQGAVYSGGMSSPAVLQNRHSMADLLQSNPAGAREASRDIISGTSPAGLVNATPPRMRHASTFQQSSMPQVQHPTTLRRSRTDQPAYIPQQQPSAGQFQAGLPMPFASQPPTGNYPGLPGHHGVMENPMATAAYAPPYPQYSQQSIPLVRGPQGQLYPMHQDPNFLAQLQNHQRQQQGILHPSITPLPMPMHPNQWAVIDAWRQGISYE